MTPSFETRVQLVQMVLGLRDVPFQTRKGFASNPAVEQLGEAELLAIGSIPEARSRCARERSGFRSHAGRRLPPGTVLAPGLLGRPRRECGRVMQAIPVAVSPL